MDPAFDRWSRIDEFEITYKKTALVVVLPISTILAKQKDLN